MIGAYFESMAEGIESEWRVVANLIGVSEDYHGYYDPCLDQVIARTIEDMLIEANPYRHSDSEAIASAWDPGSDSPVCLFNWAWQVYKGNSVNYAAWEAKQVGRWLNPQPA